MLGVSIVPPTMMNFDKLCHRGTGAYGLVATIDRLGIYLQDSITFAMDKYIYLVSKTNQNYV